jgi:hypothetical protein
MPCLDLRKNTFLLSDHLLVVLMLVSDLLLLLEVSKEAVIEELVGSSLFVKKVLVLLLKALTREDSFEIASTFVFAFRDVDQLNFILPVLLLGLLFERIRQKGLLEDPFTPFCLLIERLQVR